jgi:spore photoproduct lyase
MRPVPQEIIEKFDRVYILSNCVESKVAQRVLQSFPKNKVLIVDREPQSEVRGRLSAQQYSNSKRQLLVKPYPGKFFKRCPGATQKTNLACCNYYVLNLGSQCDMNCSYCYLQSYLNSPYLQIYSNIEQALQELDEMAQTHGHLPYRIGTGEIIDSLSLDELTLYSSDLIEFFKKHPKWTLEFKTKSNRVNQFLNQSHAGNVVVSWSVNAEEIIAREEHGTASLQERLSAARACADKGFKVAFHIDPLIWHPQWKQNYLELCSQIQNQFTPEETHVLSVGTLRFQPEQRHMMRERFGMSSYVTQAEVFQSDAGKMRYDSSLRTEMYQVVKDSFARSSSKWRLFMCMETPENWIDSFQASPMQVENLKELFRPLPKL